MMSKTLKNTASVLLVTAATALAVVAGVQLASNTGAIGSTYGVSVASASNGSLVCPRTGCAASSCHGALGQAPPTASSGRTGKTPAGGGGGIASKGSTVLLCPRTGCAASSCHGALGQRPPVRGAKDRLVTRGLDD